MSGPVCVLGASGFTGTAVVEHLLRRGWEVRALIGSGRRAWRLARHGLDLRPCDVTDRRATLEALRGCRDVVNCVMARPTVMLTGLDHTIEACWRLGVRRFVHLSSITAYGEPPPVDSVHEGAKPRPRRGTYGWLKLQQDKRIERARRRTGLPATTLCPPVVSGPYSPQILWLLRCMRAGRFAVLDGGRSPCALVDVRNLATAVECALRSDPVEGRVFVLDDRIPTWRELSEALWPLARVEGDLPQISTGELARVERRAGLSFAAPIHTLRFLGSRHARATLRQDPLLAAGERVLARGARRLALRTLLGALVPSRHSAPRRAGATPTTRSRLDPLQIARQQRGVWHSGARSEQVLGYTPTISVEESLSDFVRWYRSERGWDTEFGDLVRELERDERP